MALLPNMQQQPLRPEDYRPMRDEPLPFLDDSIDRKMPIYLTGGTMVPYDDPRYGPQTRPVRVEPNDVPEMIDRPLQRDPGDGGSGPDGISKGYVSIPNMPLPTLYDRLTPADPLGVGGGSSTQQFGKGGGAPTQPQRPITGSAITGSSPTQQFGKGGGSSPQQFGKGGGAPTQPQRPITLGGASGDEGVIGNLTSLGELAQKGNAELNSALYGGGLNLYAGGSVGRQMAGGGSTYTSEPPMSGLSSVLAMQGRLGDSTLVHMNPMEVEMLKTMSPDGNLSYNPETGLPEAFKLRDIAAFALPIAAGIAMPYLLPAMGITGVGGVTAGAIGAGLGGFGSGLIQGKGVGDSLVQGGLSGLMSYGMGSMMAPGTMTGGAEAIQGGVTSTPPLGADSMGLGGYSAAQEAAVTQGLGAAGIGAPDGSSLIAAGTPTSSFADIGFGPKGSVQYNALTDVYKPGTSESGLGQMFDNASRTSPFGNTAFGNTIGPTQVPTYTQIGGSALGSAGQMYMDSMLSPEEMPYDIAGDEAYYNSRIPDLEAGRRRGRANVRTLRRPFESIDPSEYYNMAVSPEGIGTFYSATGGPVPKPYGDPYGPGDGYGGVANESNTSGTPGSESTSGKGSMSMGSLGDPIADFGLGSFNPSPLGLGISALGMAMGIPGLGLAASAIGSAFGPSTGTGFGIGEQTGSGISGGQVSGYGTTSGAGAGLGINAYGQEVDPNAEAVTGIAADVAATAEAVASANAAAEGVGGGTGVGGADSGDNSGSGVGSSGGEESGWADGGMIDFYAQGGIASLAYGGNPPPTGYANQAFEGTVPGAGTGMSDDVPFSIEGDQPALLSRDEYVLPADVVSQLGDGSSGAGSDMLDNFISQVRHTKYGNTQQPPPVGPELMIELMRSGGIV